MIPEVISIASLPLNPDRNTHTNTHTQSLVPRTKEKELERTVRQITMKTGLL